MDYKDFFEGIVKRRYEYMVQKANKISADHLDKIASTVKSEINKNPEVTNVSVNVGKCDGNCYDTINNFAYGEVVKNIPGIKVNRSKIFKQECHASKNPGSLGLYTLYTKNECENYEELIYDLDWK